MERSPRVRAERREVAENRERILAAAEPFFTEHGLDASLHRLADEAGVGVATLFRRFPSRDDLIRALYDRAVVRVDELAARVAADSAPGWPSIVAFVEGATGIVLSLPLLPALMHRMALIDPDYRPGDRWIEPLVRDIDLAHRSGDLRPDANGYDVAGLLMALGGFVPLGEPARTMLARRHVALVLAGLRPGAEPALPGIREFAVEEFHLQAHGISDGADAPQR